MVELCNILGLDLGEVMSAKPWWINAVDERNYEELLLVEEYAE